MRSKYLLDTNAWFWMAIGDPHVPTELVSQLESAHSEKAVFLSQISPWEIALKTSLGKIELNRPLDIWLRENTDGLSMLDLPIDVVLESTRLPGSFHKDPADRFIIATARVRNLVLVTGDKAIIDYATSGYVKAVGI